MPSIKTASRCKASAFSALYLMPVIDALDTGNGMPQHPFGDIGPHAGSGPSTTAPFV